MSKKETNRYSIYCNQDGTITVHQIWFINSFGEIHTKGIPLCESIKCPEELDTYGKKIYLSENYKINYQSFYDCNIYESIINQNNVLDLIVQKFEENVH